MMFKSVDIIVAVIHIAVAKINGVFAGSLFDVDVEVDVCAGLAGVSDVQKM
jgi:hypothetical protein